MLWVKRHVAPDGGFLLACCDQELIGKSFEEGELVLSCPASYYGGEEVNNDEFLDLAERARVIAATGEVVVGLLKDKGWVQEVKVIDSVPHVQVVKIDES